MKHPIFNRKLDRRDFLRLGLATALGSLAAPLLAHIDVFGALPRFLPKRPLGSTKERVSILGFGGEGILRSWGHQKEAVTLVRAALDAGITYFDTAPAYSGSQDYYGAALGERRKEIFLASKTHDRTRDGSLKLLDKSLARLKTDHLDLWQLHDLRDQSDLDAIFGKNGAIHALKEAKADGRIKYFGVTGHHDPIILAEALKRFSFHTVLMAVNAADRARASFIEQVLPVAKSRGTAVIGMKVIAKGRLLKPNGPLSLQQAIGYVLSLPITTAIIGFSTIEELSAAVHIAGNFQMYSSTELTKLESIVRPHADNASWFKRSSSYYTLPNTPS